MKVRGGLVPLRSAWWLAALGILLGLAAAQVVIRVSTPLYRSSTELFVAARSTTDPSAAYTGTLFTQARVASYVQLIQSERVSSEVIDELGLSMTPSQLAGEVTGTAVPNTVILDISVTDSSPRRAQAIAASYGRHVSADITALEQPDPSVPSTVTVSTLEQATVQASTVSPDRLRDYALGALVGLLLGLGAADLRWRTRRAVRSAGDVEAATGAPVLATVVGDNRLMRQPLLDVVDPRVAGPEELRLLRTRVDPPGVGSPPRIVVVTSARKDDGKTTLAAQFAAALARAGRTVLLVDADVGNPSLSRRLDRSSAEGLVDVLAGTAEASAVVHARGDGGPAVLAAGIAAPGSGELLVAPKMRALLDTLCTAYDVVVIDAPPVLGGGDAGSLGALGDGCLLVGRYGSTRRKDLGEAARGLSWYGAVLLGAVLTGVPERRAVPHRRRVRYAPDPSRLTSRPTTGGTDTVDPPVPFVPAAPTEGTGRHPVTSSVTAADSP